jgi:hypothetical protein
MLAVTSREDLSPGAIHAFLDLELGDVPGVETLEEAQLMEFFSEFSVMAKAFKTLGGPNECFWEFARFFGCMRGLISIPKSRGNLLVAKWENRRIDWAVIISEALIREVSTTRKKYPAGLAYWLALIYPPPPGTEKGGSRLTNRGIEAMTARGGVPRVPLKAGPSPPTHGTATTRRTMGLTCAGPNKTTPAQARITPDSGSSGSARAVPEVGTSSSAQ